MRALRLLANLAGLLALSVFLWANALLGVFADWRWFGPLLVACAPPIVAAWRHRRSDPPAPPPRPAWDAPTVPLAMSGRPAVLEGTIVLPTITPRHAVIGTARPHPRRRRYRVGDDYPGGGELK